MTALMALMEVASTLREGPAFTKGQDRVTDVCDVATTRALMSQLALAVERAAVSFVPPHVVGVLAWMTDSMSESAMERVALKINIPEERAEGIEEFDSIDRLAMWFENVGALEHGQTLRNILAGERPAVEAARAKMNAPRQEERAPADPVQFVIDACGDAVTAARGLGYIIRKRAEAPHYYAAEGLDTPPRTGFHVTREAAARALVSALYSERAGA